MSNVTAFDSQKLFIFLTIVIQTADGKQHEFDAILDSGASATEFSDQALQYAGLLKKYRDDVGLKLGLQTQKYNKMILPKIEICSHPLYNLPVYISHFEKSWGIDALIGLDFFRQVRVTIDYAKGIIITEPY